MKHSLAAISIEVLVLAFVEFVFVGTLAAVLWYVLGHHYWRYFIRKLSMDNVIPSVFLWFTHHPFGAATMVYAASVLGVLVYAYFEPRDQVYKAPL